MDVDIAHWILEFALREGLDDRLLNALVRVIPLSNCPPSLKKTMLLRKIESVIQNGSVSPEILSLLEEIEELDYAEGIAPSGTMKAAYCAVAVGCTVGVLDQSEDKDAKYFAAVKRIWKGRVCKMEKSVKCGLVSDELGKWKDDLEAAVWDSSLWESLRMRNEGIDAVKAVRNYVAEGWDKMGPSFLKLVAETVSFDTLKEVMGLDDVQICNQVVEKGGSFSDAVHGLGVNGDKEVPKVNVLPRRKHVTNKRPRGLVSGSSRGVRIIDDEEMGLGTSSDKYGYPPTAEVNKVRKALKTSSLELQASVEDPLPDILQFAGNITSAKGGENISDKPLVDRVDVGAANSSVDKSAEAVQLDESNLRNQSSSQQNEASKQSLMERNSTAQTYEWNDSIGGSAEASPSRRSCLHLPSPRRGLVSPLKKYEITKLVRRRPRKKWSQLEEETLRSGVQKYGRGNWKFILNSYRDIFEERTEVDLKDKWRNMLR